MFPRHLITRRTKFEMTCLIGGQMTHLCKCSDVVCSQHSRHFFRWLCISKVSPGFFEMYWHWWGHFSTRRGEETLVSIPAMLRCVTIFSRQWRLNDHATRQCEFDWFSPVSGPELHYWSAIWQIAIQLWSLYSKETNFSFVEYKNNRRFQYEKSNEI